MGGAVANAALPSESSDAGAGGFARGLQKAGYAPDPAYATKLARMIHMTERVQQTLA